MIENKNDNNKIVIIGAGLTGLTTAFYLTKAGKDVVVLEANSRVGGVINTVEENNFVYEQGPNTGVLGHPEAAELLEDIEGCTIETAKEEAKKRYVMKNGRWEPLPAGLMQGIKTPLFSTKDKIGILCEPFRARGKDPDETLDKLVIRRLGQSILEYAVDPFVLGIYAGDPSCLIPRYALPKLYNLEQKYGSFIGGAIKKSFEKKTERDKKATRQIFSVKGGLSNLTRSLAAAIGEEKILADAKNITVQPADNGYNVRYDQFGHINNIAADKIITTVAAPKLQQLIPFVEDELMAPIKKLPYAKVIQAAIGFNKWEGMVLDGFGGLIPFKEGKSMLGVLFISSFLKNRAPKDGALLSVFLGGYRKPEVFEWTDEEIKKYLKKEMPEIMGMKEFNPDLLRIMRYEHAIPQYGAGTAERLQSIDIIEKKHPGLILAGNIRNGIGMADRIKQGREVAGMV